MSNIVQVKFDQTKQFDKSSASLRKIVHEYNTTHQFDAVDIAYTKVDGIYPSTGWSANDVCSMIYYILNGSAVLTSETGETFHLEARDALLLPPKTWYRIQGNFEALMICAPAWYKEQSLSKANRHQ